MRVCASYGAVPGSPADADMHEIRLDVFPSVPDFAGADDIVTLAGKDISCVPKEFKGLVDVGDFDIEIPFRKIRSVHDYERTPSAEELVRTLNSGDQELSKYACMVNSFTDLHNIFTASKQVSRKHLILGMGETGCVTRIRQRILGNDFTFGYVGKKTAAGQLSAEEMKKLGDDCKIIGITGHPLGHSLSPVMQGAAMEKAGINGIYLKFDSPDVEHLADVIREYEITGMNVTIPYKQDVMDQMDSLEGPAKAIGAVNTIINRNGKLVGTNTDCAGVQFAFENAGKKLSDCDKVLIFGAGGAARAAVYAAMKSGCGTYVLGRSPDKVGSLCREMGCEKAESPSLEGYDAVINCTPIGMNEDSEYMFPLSGLKQEMTVMDMVYNRKTQLVKTAESKGCRIASGRDMLVGQGAKSFEHWFGIRPDTDVMRKAIE